MLSYACGSYEHAFNFSIYKLENLLFGSTHTDRSFSKGLDLNVTNKRTPS